MLFVRSFLYKIVFYISAVFVPLIVVICFAFPLRFKIKLSTLWGTINLAALRYICGLKYEVRGHEHIPNEPCIYMIKHQAAWDTFSFLRIFPMFVWVVKKELLAIPIFGHCLKTLGAIGVDRSDGRKAIYHISQEGKKTLQKGLSILVFPEGTRVAARGVGQYGIGGTILAKKNHVCIIPVAHNAGDFWQRNRFSIHPGTIEVSIGKPIETKGKKLTEINAEVEHWIESEMQKIYTRYDRQCKK